MQGVDGWGGSRVWWMDACWIGGQGPGGLDDGQLGIW